MTAMMTAVMTAVLTASAFCFQTYDAIIENSFGAPLRVWNLGPTRLTDAQIDALLADMGNTDYSPQEYDTFM